MVIPLIFTLNNFTKKKLKEKIKTALRKAAPIPPTYIKSVTKIAGEVTILYIPINIFSCSLITYVEKEIKIIIKSTVLKISIFFIRCLILSIKNSLNCFN